MSRQKYEISEFRILLNYLKFMFTQPLKFLSIIPNWITAIFFIGSVLVSCLSLPLGLIGFLFTLMPMYLSSMFMVLIYGEDYLTNNFQVKMWQ